MRVIGDAEYLAMGDRKAKRSKSVRRAAVATTAFEPKRLRRAESGQCACFLPARHIKDLLSRRREGMRFEGAEYIRKTSDDYRIYANNMDAMLQSNTDNAKYRKFYAQSKNLGEYMPSIPKYKDYNIPEKELRELLLDLEEEVELSDGQYSDVRASRLSMISRSGCLTEQASKDDFDDVIAGPLHSTYLYPLHSTFRAASPEFSLPADDVIAPENGQNDSALPNSGDNSLLDEENFDLTEYHVDYSHDLRVSAEEEDLHASPVPDHFRLAKRKDDCNSSCSSLHEDDSIVERLLGDFKHDVAADDNSAVDEEEIEVDNVKDTGKLKRHSGRSYLIEASPETPKRTQHHFQPVHASTPRHISRRSPEGGRTSPSLSPFDVLPRPDGDSMTSLDRRRHIKKRMHDFQLTREQGQYISLGTL